MPQCTHVHTALTWQTVSSCFLEKSEAAALQVTQASLQHTCILSTFQCFRSRIEQNEESKGPVSHFTQPQ